MSLDSITQVLIDEFSVSQDEISFLVDVANRLYTELKSTSVAPSLSQLQQLLSLVSTGKRYQDFKKLVPEDNGNFKQFWGIKCDLLKSMMSSARGFMMHPFPPSLLVPDIPEIEQWKIQWLTHRYSMHDSPFIPPVSPKEMLGGGDVLYELHSSLEPEADFSSSEYFAIVFREKMNET